jgi:hypothetical protein
VSRERRGRQAMAPIVVNEDCSWSGRGSEEGCKWKESNGWCAYTVDEDDASRRVRGRWIWMRGLDEIVSCDAPV